MNEYIDWVSSHARYRYWFPEAFDPPMIPTLAGNYMFVRRRITGGLEPLYIGVAEDLRERLSNHERWQEAVALGAIGVMFHTETNAARRLLEERDLIGYWNPPMNTQFRRRTIAEGG